MKIKALALLSALLLVVGLSACSSSDDSSKDDDTTTTEETTETTEDDSSDTTEEEEEEEVDKAEAALDKIESNFGLSKKDPSDSTDETTGDDSEVTDSGLTPDEEECLVDALSADPDLLEVIDTLETASVEDQAAVLDVMFECVDPSVLGVAFAEGIAEANPSLTTADALCLGDAFANLAPETIAELLLLNSDPTYTPSPEAQEAILGLFTDCDIDPTSL